MAKKSASKKKKKTSKRKSVSRKRPQKKKAKKKAGKRKVSFQPRDYSSVTAYLIIGQAADAIDFYKKIFGAKEVMRMEKNGKIRHAELKIGDTKIMLADEFPEMNIKGPQAFGGSPIGLHLYVKNVDDVMNKAVSAGAKLTRAVEDMFYGDRSGGLEDPYGHIWHISTHVEDLSKAKIKKRAETMFNKTS